MPIDYSTGKVYRIYSPSHLEIGEYIGSTTQSLAQRLAKHRINYKSYKKGKSHYVSSFALLDFEDVRIDLIENHPCASKEELCAKEGEHIRGSGNCVNKVLYPVCDGQTRVESNRKYNQLHREEINKKMREKYLLDIDRQREKSKIYRESHKEEIREKARKYREENTEKVKEYQKKYREKQRKKKQEENTRFLS